MTRVCLNKIKISRYRLQRRYSSMSAVELFSRIALDKIPWSRVKIIDKIRDSRNHRDYAARQSERFRQHILAFPKSLFSLVDIFLISKRLELETR